MCAGPCSHVISLCKLFALARRPPSIAASGPVVAAARPIVSGSRTATAGTTSIGSSASRSRSGAPTVATTRTLAEAPRWSAAFLAATVRAAGPPGAASALSSATTGARRPGAKPLTANTSTGALGALGPWSGGPTLFLLDAQPIGPILKTRPFFRARLLSGAGSFGARPIGLKARPAAEGTVSAAARTLPAGDSAATLEVTLSAAFPILAPERRAFPPDSA